MGLVPATCKNSENNTPEQMGSQGNPPSFSFVYLLLDNLNDILKQWNISFCEYFFFSEENECHANELLPTISNSPQQFGNSTKLPNDVI